MVGGDVGTLDQLLAKGYTARHITGYEQAKNEWLAQILDGQFTYDHIEQESLEIRVDGGSWVATRPTSMTY
jgi:hypothetical protein